MAKVAFNVDAYTARLIGRENVSKLDGAIIELVKNTYDADASVCFLYYDDVADVLYIADNGTGMTQDVIVKHWMTIGRSSKKATFVTDSGRIQTGAKGIGRFALDRIAEQCTMITGTEEQKEKILWTVDWSEFTGNKNITEITADLENEELSFSQFMGECHNDEVRKLVDTYWKVHGTIFKLSNMREHWDENLIHEMHDNLSSLIPFELEKIYKIYCFDNQTGMKDAQVFSNIDAFSYDYKIEFQVGDETDTQRVEYRIWREEFDFGSREDEILAKADLLEEKAWFHGKPIEKTGVFREFVPDRDNSIGTFSGTLYFSKMSTTRRDRERFYQRDISNRVDVRDTFGGVKIYRDSFRVRPYGDPKSSSYDWLQLARRKNASPAGVGTEKGIWRVSADQMLGSIFISRMNTALPDQSNREGIVETPEFQLLKEFVIKMIELLEQDRQYVSRKLNALYVREHPTEDIENDIRRKAKDSEKKKAKPKEKQEDPKPENEDQSDTSDDLKVKASDAQKVLDAKDEQIEELQTENKMLRALATTGIVTNTYIHEFKTLTHKLNMKITMAKEAIDLDQDIQEAGEYIDQANDIRKAFNSWFEVTIEAVKSDKRRRRKVDLIKIIAKLVASWNQTLSNKDIHILFADNVEDEIMLKCFPYEIETIINNLITNSVASFEKTRMEQQEIRITLSEGEEYVIIDYEDTGAGLSSLYKNNPEKILEAFETSKRNKEGELIGTGMGMWIVNNTVLDYRGKIELEKNIKTKTGFYAIISLKK